MGAFGGRADIMNCIAPMGPVYQAGTLSGNPIAMASGLATITLSEPGFLSAYRQLPVNWLTASRLGLHRTVSRLRPFQEAGCLGFSSPMQILSPISMP